MPEGIVIGRSEIYQIKLQHLKKENFKPKYFVFESKFLKSNNIQIIFYQVRYTDFFAKT